MSSPIRTRKFGGFSTCVSADSPLQATTAAVDNIKNRSDRIDMALPHPGLKNDIDNNFIDIFTCNCNYSQYCSGLPQVHY
jgi:hypothetical protein